MDKPAFFPGDHPELRERLHRYLAGLKARIGESGFAPRVALLLLAGGYGRGEGGVFTGDETLALYNDLEFYLVLDGEGEADSARAWCAEESHRGEAETGIEVEFKILSYPALCRAEPSMFYYDLLTANVLVYGDEKLLRSVPARLRDARCIPAHEATRLLFNRGAGLWFCEQALRADSERVRDGFVERNHAKVRLAFADAVLALNGRYDVSALERQRRLEEPLTRVPSNWTELVRWHAEAVAFKFHPRHENPDREELARRQESLVVAWRGLFLWLESVRLGRQFDYAEDYAAAPGRLFPDLPVWRNVLLHARDGMRRRLTLGGWRDYPRAALQRTLALCIDGSPENDWERNTVTHLLALPADATHEQVEEKFRRGWQFYN